MNMGMGLSYFGDRKDEDWNPVDNAVPDIHRGHLSPHQWQFVHMNDSSSASPSTSDGSHNVGGGFVPENESGKVYYISHLMGVVHIPPTI